MGSGGTCSGRQIPFGYWCAPNCPRHKFHQTGYNPPGAIYYENSTLARVVHYSKPKGAVFHAIAGSFDDPFYSVACLVDAVNATDAVTGLPSLTVEFDHLIGCDQGATWNQGGDELNW